MIDFDVLCQTIEDWKAGRRPSAPIPGPTPAAPSAGYEQVDSGLVMMEGEGGYDEQGQDEQGQYADGSGQYAEGYAAPGSGQYDQYGDGSGQYAESSDPYGGEVQYAEQSYGEPISATEGYGEDGAPMPVQRTGTPQVTVGEEPPPYAADEHDSYGEMIDVDESAPPEGDEEEIEVDDDDDDDDDRA